MGRNRGRGVSEGGGLGSVVTEVVVWDAVLLELGDKQNWTILQTLKQHQPIFKR